MKSSYRILGFICLSAIAINLSAQNFAKDSIKLYKHISFLSSDSLGGRSGGSDDEKIAADYIAMQLKASKLKPYFGKSYFQTFEFNYESQTFSSQNVAAFIDNKADSTIIIISHYDHIGNGGKLSKSFGSDKIHPGADDNASGVAANLLLAEKIKKSKNKKYNFIFLFLGAHEKGLFGSQNFLEQNQSLIPYVCLIINLDMIGRLDKNTKTMIFETQNFAISNAKLSNYSENNLIFQNKEKLIGDHTAYANSGTKTIILSSGIHSDYHKTSDTADKINYLGISEVIAVVKKLIEEL